MRAYLFGAFNPPTNAHIAMGQAAMQALGERPEHIIYVPSGEKYIRSWKGYIDMIPAGVRYGLLKTVLESYGFGVAKVEVYGITTKTYDTMEYLGFDDSFLCLGTDNVAQMKKWYRYDELLQKINLMVFERPGSESLDNPQVKEVMAMAKSHIVVPLSSDYTGVSSSLVRKSIENGNLEQVKRLVPDNVYEYLICNNRKVKE